MLIQEKVSEIFDPTSKNKRIFDPLGKRENSRIQRVEANGTSIFIAEVRLIIQKSSFSDTPGDFNLFIQKILPSNTRDLKKSILVEKQRNTKKKIQLSTTTFIPQFCNETDDDECVASCGRMMVKGKKKVRKMEENK